MSEWIFRRAPSAGLLFITLLFALSRPAPVHAQTQAHGQGHDRRPLQSVINSALDDDAAHPVAYFTQAAEAEPLGAPPTYTVSTPPRVVMGPLYVIAESIFGPASKDDWKPMTLMTFFSEGWDQPFVNAPEGTSGAPKQNWIGAPNGVFGRFATLDFFYTNHINDVPGVFLTPNAPFMPVHTFTTGNQYAAYSTILLPLNSRMELLLGTVFISSNKSSPAGHYTGNWGDTGIQARFHMIEQRNFSVVSTIGERIPTGKSVNGNDINYITPGLEFWWNFAPQWVLRGGSSINILTGRRSGTSVYVNQLSMGRYLTTKEATYFKELVVHLTATALSDIAGGAGHVNDIYLFPGLRFGLGKPDTWYALFGVQVPVSGPQPYVWQPQFALTRNY
jgi:hypothetical protein